jgi:hypothetical protein
VAELRLAIGEEVYAMVKAVSIDRQAVTTRPPLTAALPAAAD